MIVTTPMIATAPLVVFFALIVGFTVGSFLNVVIYRLPLMMERRWKADCCELLEQAAPENEAFNLAFPNSHCPHCDHEIRIFENIPLISYLFLKGQCSQCKQAISLRYPIVELITGILSALVAWKFGLSWETLAALFLTWSLITLAVIDFDTTLLPDDITLPLLWAGLIISFKLDFSSVESALIGAIVGYLSLWSVYWLFKLITGKEGMGYGDFKLLAALGAWMGWKALPMIIVLSSFVGALVGISLIIFLGRDKNIPIPFGPYLATAGWISLMWGDSLLRSYLSFFSF